MGFEDKLNNLATAINNKTGSVGKKTLDQLTTAVTNLNTNGLITKNNIISNKDIYSWAYSSVSSFYLNTTWSGGGTGIAGTNWYVLCTVPNIEEVIIPGTNQIITANTYYPLCVSSCSSSDYYRYAFYLYYNDSTKTAYILQNSANSSYWYRYMFCYSSTYCVPYLFVHDIILKSSATISAQVASTSSYGSGSMTLAQYKNTATAKSQVIISNYASDKKYTLIRGFYFTNYNTLNLISSELEEAS